MDPAWLWVFAVAAYVLTRCAEYRLHQQNYRYLTASGAEELIPRRMKFYYRLTLVILPCALIEHVLLSQPIFWEMITGGLFLVAMGLGLRIWAIHCLGQFWSMRCLALQGIPKIKSGPYRLFRNPEYISRILDGIGLCLLIGSRFSLVAFLVLMALATARISPVERRQLRELSGLSL